MIYFSTSSFFFLPLLYLLHLDANTQSFPLFVKAAPTLPILEPSYSIWLSPSFSDQATSTLSSLITYLAGPQFSPHATLLSEAPPFTRLDDLLVNIEAAVKDTCEERGKGVEVKFGSVRTGEGFFEVVLVELKASPPLLSLQHNVALSVLPSNTTELPAFCPHFSLLYSNITIPEREAIAAQLYLDGFAVPVQGGGGGGVELFSPAQKLNGSAVEGGYERVRCDRISVVVTKGLEVEEWIVVGEVVI